jgi:molybdate transport system substrate-binding protein
MATLITGISSMATRYVLAELGAAYEQHSGVTVKIESMGGVDAAARVRAGEVFDVAVLTSDAIDKLIAAGRVVAGSKVDLVHSGVAVAVRAGAPLPGIGSETELKRAVLAARSIGYSTGPSGVALTRLFERWGVTNQLSGRIVQAPPGTPVGALVVRGEVELGFQQLSELLHIDGLTIVGSLPPEVQTATTFSAGLCTASTNRDMVRGLLDFLVSRDAAGTKRRHGMEPA